MSSKFSPRLQAQIIGTCVRAGLSPDEAIDALLFFAACGHAAQVEERSGVRSWDSRVEDAWREANAEVVS